MSTTINPFLRAMTTSFEVSKFAVQITETMIASHTVIVRRMMMFGSGIQGSGKIPFSEFSRLVPEKAAAFGKANAGVTRVMKSRGLMPPTITGSALADSMAMLDWWELSFRAANAWWLPVHAAATANAKRLSRRRA